MWRTRCRRSRSAARLYRPTSRSGEGRTPAKLLPSLKIERNRDHKKSTSRRGSRPPPPWDAQLARGSLSRWTCRSNSLRPSPGPRRVGSRDPTHPPPWHRRIFSNPRSRMTGSLVLSSSAGIYYPLPQKGRSAQRPARGVQPPGLLGDLYPHPSPLAEIALQYNHRHNPRQQQRHLAVARDRASPVNCPRSGARSGGGDGKQEYSPPVLLFELAQ